jgi:uncharacterized membrane protein
MNAEDVIFNTVILGIGRFLDLLSTWYSTPNFDIEVNSWMKKVGWRGVILINIVLVPTLSSLAHERTVFLGVLSSIVALRNFQAGTMARAMGETAYINAYRQFVRNSPWYLPLLPIFCEVIIYITIGMTIIELIGKPENVNQKYVGTIGAALLTFGLILGTVTIIQRIEKKLKENQS